MLASVIFHSHLPSHFDRYFLDMEWLISRGGPSASMEVDIGHMSRMELRSATPSVKMNETGLTPEQLITAMNDTMYDELLKSYPWMDDTHLTEKQVFDLLERSFYPFKEVISFEIFARVMFKLSLLDSILRIH